MSKRRPGFRKRRRAMHWESSGRTKGKEGRRRRTVERRSARAFEEPVALSRDELRRLEVLAEFSGFAAEDLPRLPRGMPMSQGVDGIEADGWHIARSPEKTLENLRQWEAANPERLLAARKRWFAANRVYRRNYERAYWRKPENAERQRQRSRRKWIAEKADSVRHAKRLASWAAYRARQREKRVEAR